MKPSDAIDARSFWQGQVADWQDSGLTQKAYCEEQGLRYTAFGYWVRKLRRAAKPSPRKKPTSFVPVVPDTATGLILLCHISDSRRRQAAKASCLRRCRS